VTAQKHSKEPQNLKEEEATAINLLHEKHSFDYTWTRKTSSSKTRLSNNIEHP
jgi:hypothetical protein